MKKIKKIQSFICTLLLTGLLIPFLSLPVASAQEFFTLTPGATEEKTKGPSGLDRTYILEDPSLTDIPDLLSYAIKFMLSLAGLAAVFFIFSGSFQYISGLTIEQKQKGKTQILYAIVGLAVITLSYAIVETLLTVLF